MWEQQHLYLCIYKTEIKNEHLVWENKTCCRKEGFLKLHLVIPFIDTIQLRYSWVCFGDWLILAYLEDKSL